MGDNQFDDYDDDSEEESSEDFGIGAILEVVDNKCKSAQEGLDNIREELDSHANGLDDSAKLLFQGVVAIIKNECAMVEQKMESMIDTIDGIQDFVNPDQKKMHDLQQELKQLRTDYAVTLQRVEDEEGAGFTQSKAQIKRAETRTRRNEITLNAETQAQTKPSKKHDRHFSLMDMYAAFDEDNSDNSDNSDESSESMDDHLVAKKFNVTMDSASYHCGVIKDVLREMIAEISGISEGEQSLCMSVSDAVGGSIDRVQFALDNLYDQGLSEHENWKETRSELQKTRKELDRVKSDTKSQLDNLYTKLQNKGSPTGSDDDFLESMKSLGLRDLDAEIRLLESENTDLVTAIEKEREACEHAEREVKNKAAQLRKLHKDHEDLREIFEQCQEQLADAKSLIAELETVDMEDYHAIKEQLQYARVTKMTTLSFLDAEIRRLKSEIYSIYKSHNSSGSQQSRAFTWNGLLNGA